MRRRSKSVPPPDVRLEPPPKERAGPAPAFIEHTIEGRVVRFVPVSAPGWTSYYYTDADKRYFLKLPRDFLNYDVLHREVFVLNMLKPFANDCFPSIVASNREYIIFDYIGPMLSASNAPPDLAQQIHRILAILEANNLRHGDIKNDELLVKDGRVFLVDFGWALYENAWGFGNRFSPRLKPSFYNVSDEDLIIDTFDKAAIKADIVPKTPSGLLEKRLTRLTAMLEVLFHQCGCPMDVLRDVKNKSLQHMALLLCTFVDSLGKTYICSCSE